MEFIGFLTMAVFIVVVLYLLCRLLLSCWVFPVLTYRKLKKNGLTGPTPSFPLGNLSEMKKKTSQSSTSSSFGPSSNSITHDIHSTLFPYFARWQKAYGKMFVYWLGTEPFLYVADAALLKKLSSEVTAKNWGKPAVFRRDRAPMFGNGLVMSEGDDWVRHRHVITPAFNPTNLKAMASLMVETATTMLDNWATQINTSGIQEIDVEDSITATAGEIIAKTSFGISHHSGSLVFEKLRALQMTLFKTTRFVGVPFGKFIYPMKTLEAGRLGEEINQLFLSIIAARKKSIRSESPQHDLLGMLLKESDKPGNFSKSLTTQELVDECKTFFFGGHETTALAITWTMLLLATHTDWQEQLRAEIKEVVGDKEIDVNNLAGLKKMGWVMNEVLRLYPSAPNAQRQAKDDIQVSEDLTIPKGTNMWIDTVGMHHDPELWGEDVHEFKPERFKMGYLPFGFGGRMCIGRNLTFLEYKIVLTLILSRFSFTVSPTYTHAPSIALSLRPCNGLPLVLQPLN
ncbi:putative cytochrome P450 [Rosa chinensis]|uniref:Putative cytochrome P450 n=1 Tax=Rosa chinensis TaxID=74649 RepID=A0A2P6SN43_ROSCH|nr:cytokinin hydroxylase [Rosa chinensis]PRQ60107.1 putative cytochrome P450 [Rosa chinensis]